MDVLVVAGVCVLVAVVIAMTIPLHVADRPLTSCGPRYIKAHHSAITNTHRFLYYVLGQLPGNPYQIPIVGNTNSRPPADTTAMVSGVSISYVSEFDVILGYLYGLTAQPFHESIYGQVYGLPPGAVTSDCVLVTGSTCVQFNGIVLPRDLTTITIATPIRTYTITVIGRSKPSHPIIHHGLLRWNQGDLGSCAAVSTASVIHAATGLVVSPLAIYWAARGGSSADTGTLFELVLAGINTHGVVMEADFPYDPARYDIQPPMGRPLVECQLKIIYSTQEAKQHLDRGKPVAIATTLSTSALGPKTLWDGVIPWEGSRTAGHVVVAVGYSSKGFIVDMNWETWWGYKGLGILPEAYFESGVVAVTN